MTTEEKIALENYYAEIEKTSELMPCTLPPSAENISDDVLFCIRVEYLAQTALTEELINEMFAKRIDEVVEYLKTRIEVTPNIILKAKYNEIIYIITKNRDCCVE